MAKHINMVGGNLMGAVGAGPLAPLNPALAVRRVKAPP